MPNLLYDALFAPLANRETPLLITAAGKPISGSAFHAMVMRYAAALASLGLEPGDRLAVQVAKSPQALAVYGASVAAGVVFLPLNTAYTASEVAYFVENSGAKLLIGDGAQAESLRLVAERSGTSFRTMNGDGSGTFADVAAAIPAEFIPVDRGPEDLAAFLYTSGTTGRSKGAMLSQSGASPATTCCCTLCRSSIRTVCSSLPTSCSCRAAR